jgi:small subunit ribosomal protein S16
MLMIRLTRCGMLKKSQYRVVAIDKRKARDGKAKEYLGFYNSDIQDSSDNSIFKINILRTAYLLKNGAQLSKKVIELIRKHGKSCIT